MKCIKKGGGEVYLDRVGICEIFGDREKERLK